MTGITLRGIWAQGLKVAPPDDDGYYFLVDLEDAHLDTLLAKLQEAGVHGPIPTIQLGPEDRLALQAPRAISAAEQEHIKARMQAWYKGGGNSPIILDRGLQLSIIRNAAAEIPQAQDLKQALSYAQRAMAYLEAIPDDAYTPYFNEGIVEAFNTLDDAIAGLAESIADTEDKPDGH